PSRKSGVHIEIASGKTAKELHIPMPNPTIKPLICAAGMIVMFTGLLFIHKDKMPLALATMIGGALIMVTSLYAWLLTSLEDAHDTLQLGIDLEVAEVISGNRVDIGDGGDDRSAHAGIVCLVHADGLLALALDGGDTRHDLSRLSGVRIHRARARRIDDPHQS